MVALQSLGFAVLVWPHYEAKIHIESLQIYIETHSLSY